MGTVDREQRVVVCGGKRQIAAEQHSPHRRSIATGCDVELGALDVVSDGEHSVGRG